MPVQQLIGKSHCQIDRLFLSSFHPVMIKVCLQCYYPTYPKQAEIDQLHSRFDGAIPGMKSRPISIDTVRVLQSSRVMHQREAQIAPADVLISNRSQ